ncbi:DUF1292 domain-containing protein [Effusibacillus dendaii]|uniref:DUF1292 domain-containing protein n=1 Tax=Effusibacillus dendaii TaxID=2743772 RepID=A0A7I8D7U7_9BACL|nr:DUF1292 domain-containing protein [Effusibacillus dendaii]BCJ86184.1 DUF1292 domain-containing protein [Effusibacillus dendaii]
MADKNHVHGPDCDHDHEQAVIVLTDDEGVDHEFIVADVMELEGNSYAILVPHDQEEGEAVILRVETDEEGEEYLIDIEDDAEWERVVAAYEQLAAGE